MAGRQQEKRTERLARERGTIRRAWGDRLSVCLLYANRYATGMSNLGFQTVYGLLNTLPSVVCERAFLPDPEDAPSRASGSPNLTSLESGRPLGDFDVVAFSLSFENDYPNVLKLLSLGRIEPLASRRGPRDPLILAGGVAVTLNPEPLADFMDLFFLGEAEEALPELTARLLAAREEGLGRDECLYGLQREVEGVYVPRWYYPSYRPDGPLESFAPRDPTLPVQVRRRWVARLDIPVEQAVDTPDAALGDMFLTEVSRGCPRGCRFCAAGYVYLPARFRDWPSVEASLRRGLERAGRIGLVGTAVSDHPDLLRMCRYILERQGRIAVGSLRLDRLNREAIGLLKAGGVETLAIAPEAGSQRLRDMMGKGIDQGDIDATASALLEEGMENLRVYVMIGLPGETEEDVEALVEMVAGLARHSVSAGGRDRRFRRITVSVNQFIPKPVTPFQWEPLERPETVKRRLGRIRAAFRARGPVRIQAESLRGNYLQTLLSLGDRRVGGLLLEHSRTGSWPAVFRAAPLSPDFWVYRRKPLDELLPWDFIATPGVRSLKLAFFNFQGSGTQS